MVLRGLIRAALAVVAAIFLECVLPAIVHARTCECIDLGDIRQRMREARTAIDTYQREIEKMENVEHNTGKELDIGLENQRKLTARVQEALNDLYHRSGRISTGAQGVTALWDDESKLCLPTVLQPGVSQCMRQSVLAHEAVHKKACIQLKALTEVLKDYAREEIEAYRTELTFLTKEQIQLLQAQGCGGYRFDRAVVDFEAPAYAWDARIPSFSDRIPWVRHQYIFTDGSLCPSEGANRAIGPGSMIITSIFDSTDGPVHLKSQSGFVRADPETPRRIPIGPDFVFIPGVPPKLVITIDYCGGMAGCSQVPIRGSKQAIVPLEAFAGCAKIGFGDR